jgi:MFS family permease
VPRAVRGFADITQTLRDIAPDRLLTGMLALAVAASFFVGNSYQAQMPAFARDLGHGDPGVSYSALLAADAAGALLAGVLLESVGRLKPAPRTAMAIACGWALALAAFSQAHAYGLALALLFCAGFLELSFSSMVQTLVQLNAPAPIRGRVIGLFNMASLGMRCFSGLIVGLVGSAVGVHGALLAAALLMASTALALRVKAVRAVASV